MQANYTNKEAFTANTSSRDVGEKKEDTYIISKKHIALTKGIDVHGFNEQNGVKETLTLPKERRNEFAYYHPNASRLLRRNPLQPLLEQGAFNKLDSEDRQRLGEDFITYEAVGLLIYKKILEKSKVDARYDSHNVFVIPRQNSNSYALVHPDAELTDNGRLKYIFKHLNLTEGQDAKIIVVDQIHMIPLYLRLEQGKMNAFIGESFGTYDNDKTKNIIKDIREQYPEANIIASSTPIQHDYFSCTTHSIKSLMYFAKHGKSLFSEIDKPENIMLTESGLKVLKKDRLPPAFMKLAMQNIAVPESDDHNDKRLVSIRQGFTLPEYHNHYKLDIQGKSCNAAPIVKKYHYVSELEQVLKDLGVQRGRVSPNAAVPLPLEVEDIINDLTLPEQFRTKYKGYSKQSNTDKTSFVQKVTSSKELASDMSLHSR